MLNRKSREKSSIMMFKPNPWMVRSSDAEQCGQEVGGEFVMD